jgi:hypothetical protein
VRNKAAPEGCIAEGYIATELVTFCSRYLDNAPTFHNRPQRNPDGSKGAGMQVSLTRLTMHQIHRYIAFNSEKFILADVSSVYIFNRIQLKLLIMIST